MQQGGQREPTKCGFCRDKKASICCHCAGKDLREARVEVDYTYRMKRDLEKALEKRIEAFMSINDKKK